MNNLSFLLTLSYNVRLAFSLFLIFPQQHRILLLGHCCMCFILFYVFVYLICYRKKKNNDNNNNKEEVIKALENTSVEMLSWFANGIKANPGKCHLLLSTEENCHAVIGNHNIENSKQQKLLGILLDNKLNFEKHISNLCTKASQKLSALCRVSYFMSTKQKRIIMKAFINSQFGYCPLVCMNHSRKLNNRINRSHERALRVVYNDEISTFDELLTNCNIS